MSQYRYTHCATPGCEAKFSTFDAKTDDDFIDMARGAGWAGDPARCPECNAPTTPETDEHPILVLPLASGGAFTAYCPKSMTPTDWKAVQAVCGAMAGVERQTATGSVVLTTPCSGDTTAHGVDTPSLADILIRDWNNVGRQP